MNNLKENLKELHTQHGISAIGVLNVIKEFELTLKHAGVPDETNLNQQLNDIYIELHEEWLPDVVDEYGNTTENPGY